MDIFLAHEDSLKVLRHARRTEDLALIPADREEIHRDHGRIDASSLTSALPEGILAPTRMQPVSLRFADDASRSQCGIVRAVPNLARLPDSSYLELISSTGGPPPHCGRGARSCVCRGGRALAPQRCPIPR